MSDTSFLKDKMELPLGWEQGIKAFKPPQGLENFPDGMVLNINKLKNQQLEKGETFTVSNLIWIMVKTCDIVKRVSGEELGIKAYLFMYKYLDILFPDSQLRQTVTDFMLSPHSENQQ